jgi:hypothetical protein
MSGGICSTAGTAGASQISGTNKTVKARSWNVDVIETLLEVNYRDVRSKGNFPAERRNFVRRLTPKANLLK